MSLFFVNTPRRLGDEMAYISTHSLPKKEVSAEVHALVRPAIVEKRVSNFDSSVL
jgi:hypothetical protein